MPLSLAVALKTWSDQASQLLPASVLTELNPLVDKAGQVIRDSQSELAERWLESVHQSPRPFAGNPEIRRSTPDPRRLWRGHRKFSAEIQRVIKERTVWLCYDRINPLGILNQSDGPILLCTLSELDPKVYGIPFDHIKNVELTNFSATQPKDFNIQKLIRDQGYQDVSGPIRFVGRIDANCPTLIDGQIPGHNPRMTRYDKRSVVVETEVQDTPEFRSWLNNMSGDLEVLAPRITAQGLPDSWDKGQLKKPADNTKPRFISAFVYF